MSVMAPLFSGDYMPHGMCYAWEPSILWTSIVADTLIAASYFCIPIAILVFIRRRQIKAGLHIYVLFSAFIFLCGMTHLMGILTIFKGYYGWHALIKAATGVVSFTTAVYVFRYLPLALKIPSLEEFKQEQQHTAENQLFRSLSLNSPNGLMVVSQDLTIKHVNPKICALFGYNAEDLVGQSVNLLVDESTRHYHQMMMKQYQQNPVDLYKMNSGRLVHGVTQDQQRIPIQISLTSGIFDNQPHIFVAISDVADKHEAEQKLRKSLMRIERITEAAENGLWEWNIQSKQLWSSPTLIRMIGGDPEAGFNIQQWFKHIHESYRKPVRQEIELALHQHRNFEVEYEGATCNGEQKWFRVTGKLFFSENNEPILLSGALSNIDTLKKHAVELNQKSDYLEKVLNNSISGIYIFNFETASNQYINDQYTRMTGYTLADLERIKANEGFETLFHPDDLASIYAHMEAIQHAQIGESRSIEYRFKHKDGHWIWCLSRDTAFTLSNHHVVDMLGTFIDISQIKDAQKAQQALLRDFRNTFEQAAVGVAHVALDGSWINVNQKVCDIVGYEKAELLATNFQTITHPDDLGLDLHHVQDLIDGKADHYDMEKRYIHKNGHQVWIKLTVAIVRDDHHQPEYFISVIEDIGERKHIEQMRNQLNRELKKTNESLSRFAYSASHDLQEPLRKITSFSSSLLHRLKGKALDSESSFELNRLHSSATRMKTMIDRLLELSRSTHRTLDKQVCTLTDVVHDATSQLSLLIEESRAQVNLMSSGELYCDTTVLSNVLQNLISNSIKYRHQARLPDIQIALDTADGHAIITLTDNGNGFDNQFSEQIFDPFKRLVNNSEIEGTGMGLAICKQLIELHKGTISAHAIEGQGATFVIHLPNQDNHDVLDSHAG